jgi:maltose/moltooligosaccharide transporter
LDKIRTKKTLLLAGAILASAALFIMPNSLYGLQQNVMDYGCFHQRFYGAISCFVGDNLPEKQRTMGFACKVFYWDWRLLRIKTTLILLIGLTTAPLGIILTQLNTPFILVESHLL